MLCMSIRGLNLWVKRVWVSRRISSELLSLGMSDRVTSQSKGEQLPLNTSDTSELTPTKWDMTRFILFLVIIYSNADRSKTGKLNKILSLSSTQNTGSGTMDSKIMSMLFHNGYRIIANGVSFVTVLNSKVLINIPSELFQFNSLEHWNARVHGEC